MDRISQENSYTSPLVYVIAFILAIHMFTFPFANVPQLQNNGPSWLGLDVSWQMTLNYARMHDWIWGKDIVYTYGPLGYLAMRMGWGVSRWIFLLFDLFMVINFFYVFKDFLKSSASKLLGVLILLASTLMMHTSHGSDLSWVLLFFMYYWLYKTYLKPTNFAYGMLIILALITFYVKVNTGLIGMCILVAHLVLMYFIEKISLLKGLLILGILVTTTLVSAWIFHVDLPGYIFGAFEIIKGYTDIMYLNNGEIRIEHNLGLLYAMIKYLFIAYFVYLLLKGKFVQFFYLFIAVAYILLLKKQALLRGDVQHLTEFFCYAPLVLLTGNMLFFKNDTQKIFASAILFIITIALFFKTEFYQNIDGLFHNRYSHKKEYLQEFKDSKNIQYLSQVDKRYVPDTVLTEIGDATIDVFPWDTEYLIENKLNYHPRPVFQSFSAYTLYLQQLNYDFYVNNGPEYVMYDYESIDNRYPFNDEAMLNMYIIKNYHLTDTFTSNERLRSILKRKTDATPLIFNQLEKRDVNIGDEIPIISNANFIRMNPSMNFAGKKEAFKARTPEMQIQFNTDDRQSYTFKVSPELLKAGIMVEELILTQQDYLSLLTQNKTLKKIISVRLLVNQDLFKKQMAVTYYNVK